MWENFKNRLFFNFCYLGSPPWDTEISPPELMRFIKLHSPASALDLGCGTGTNLLTLANTGWKTVGIDFSHKAVRMARKKLEGAGKIDFKVIQGDVTRVENVGGPFKLVLDIGCYHGLSTRSKIIYQQRLQEWMEPGGYYILYAQYKSMDKGIGLSEREVLELTSNNIVVERIEGYDSENRKSFWLLMQSGKPSAGDQ
jgi:hypothetical protein